MVEFHEGRVAGFIDEDSVLIFDCEKLVVLLCGFEGTDPKDDFDFIFVSGFEWTSGSEGLLEVFFHVFDFDLWDLKNFINWLKLVCSYLIIMCLEIDFRIWKKIKEYVATKKG